MLRSVRALQRPPVRLSSRLRERTQVGQARQILSPSLPRPRAPSIQLKVVSRSPVKLDERLVRLLVTKSSPMLPKSREISRAWVPLQRLKSTQFSITTKASFRVSKRFPSISGSGADLARLILRRPPVKAAMMAAREFSSSPI